MESPIGKDDIRVFGESVINTINIQGVEGLTLWYGIDCADSRLCTMLYS